MSVGAGGDELKASVVGWFCASGLSGVFCGICVIFLACALCTLWAGVWGECVCMCVDVCYEYCGGVEYVVLCEGACEV